MGELGKTYSFPKEKWDMFYRKMVQPTDGKNFYCLIYSLDDKAIGEVSFHGYNSATKVARINIKIQHTNNTDKKDLYDEGHRTEEHSVENVLYSLNHFKEEVNAFCCLAGNSNEKELEKISSDIAGVWNKDDSIIVSTDWNHFVSTDIIDELMKESSSYLEKGDISSLYMLCKQGKLEACGIDGLYLASKILAKANEKTEFNVLTSTDSSKAEIGFMSLISDTCVGYISAVN